MRIFPPFRYREKNPKKELRSQPNLPYNLSRWEKPISNWVKFESTLSDPTTAQWGALRKSCQFSENYETSAEIYFNVFLLTGASSRSFFVYFISKLRKNRKQNSRQKSKGWKSWERHNWIKIRNLQTTIKISDRVPGGKGPIKSSPFLGVINLSLLDY